LVILVFNRFPHPQNHTARRESQVARPKPQKEERRRMLTTRRPVVA
jgi:hypothetical protein